MNSFINELKMKINGLKNKIIELEKVKEEYSRNSEKIRLFIVRNVIIGGIVHAIGYFTSPYLIIAGMLFASLSVVPFGIVYLHRGNVEDKYQKEIDAYNEKLKILNDELEKCTKCEYIEPLKDMNLGSQNIIDNLLSTSSCLTKNKNKKSTRK